MSSFTNYIASTPAEELYLNLFLSVILLFWLFVAIAAVVNHFVTAIPLYIMASKAGYDYPFLAFIPFANYYLMHILPIKEYSFLGMYKTNERQNGFFIYLVVKYVLPFCLGFVFMFLSLIPFVSWFIGLFSWVFTLAIRVVVLIAIAIMRIDLIQLYMKESKETATILGVISLFVPIMFPVVLFIICSKEPSFGFGNYYDLWITEEEE